MTDVDLRDEISRLESHLEELAESVERCRKIIQASKIAIAAGFLWIAATMLGAVWFNPAIMIVAMATVIGGIVVFGSTTTTSKQTLAAMKDAEARRAELIGTIELRVVQDDRAGQGR